ncbi:MAG: ribosomal-protein-alanine N-acetyltransferase [Gammaproteobacteria bacterium CG_4_10_14_0_8_um_filter_38_16]|nr:MAG: ribosomal-protein-alanine N-acetyltransferase [Gammaproteobacteria bacterium CG_4_10_14_0_8_um_filter_38_16]PJA02647.1 MAG: ribosomal-protein-alanine N-acetyltransferase [Gammaproteobacteria bacterium CG_4_10_14_0_2_um_filter_38_22]PJB11103.1 MAG: ribosomal-protein-alanine N-acetyltransferase [Gammaproteobacteria bacterium CG_4_9_14_3_um_filter_38_9]
MIENFNIKQLDIDDLPNMSRILQNTTSDWNTSVLAACFHVGYQHWGIFIQDTMLGFVVIHGVQAIWEVMHLVIDREYQRQGLAKQLMQFVFSQAKKEGVKKLELEVRVSNDSAISLYQHLHFHQVGLRKKYYSNGEDAILMDALL